MKQQVLEQAIDDLLDAINIMRAEIEEYIERMESQLSDIRKESLRFDYEIRNRVKEITDKIGERND